MSYRYTRGDVLLPVEKPEARLRIQERLERQQVARLEHMIMPTEEDGFGLEMTNGWRFVIFATQDDATSGGRYRWRLCYRAIPTQKIWTKRMDAHYRDQRRPEHKRFPEPRGGALQERIEGQMVTGFLPTYEAVQPHSGEQVTVEFVGGARWILTAGPAGPEARDCPATIHYEWVDPPRRLISLPGEPVGPPRPILID